MRFSLLLEVDIPDEKLQDESLDISATLGLTKERCKELLSLSTTLPDKINVVTWVLASLDKGLFTDNELVFLILYGSRHKETWNRASAGSLLGALGTFLSPSNSPKE